MLQAPSTTPLGRAPGPPARQALRNLLAFRRNPVDWMSELHGQYGDLVRVRLGPKLFHFCFHPDHAKLILQTQAERFHKSRLIFNKIRSVTGQRGLVQLEGKPWAKMRQITNQCMSHAALGTYEPVIERFANEASDRIESRNPADQPVDLSTTLRDLVLRTAGWVVLGIDIQAQAPQIGEAFLILNHACGKAIRSMIHLPAILSTRAARQTRWARKVLRRELDQLIDNRLKEPTGGHDLLSCLLVALKPSAAQQETWQLIRDQITTFLFAGHETTASSLAWTFDLLAHHPQVAEAVYKECAPRTAHSRLGASKAWDLPFTQQVYQESLRLFPPAWILARQTLNPISLGSCEVPGNTQILLSIHRIHRHPDFWADPDRFDPDRFADHRPQPFAFLPFGAGPRVCSGVALARLEATIVLATFCQRFCMTPTAQKPASIEALITTHPAQDVHLHMKPMAKETTPWS